MQVTISTHNGSQAHREHNVRNEKVVSKEDHIKQDGAYEIWKDEKPREAYEKLFGKAVARYNEKQTREDRKIKNYYADICKDAKKHPVYEMIIGVYPQDGEKLDQDVQKKILRDFVDSWQVRNPNLYMCGAYYHADEEGEPHVHIDYIPVARGYKRGMDTQNGLVKALESMGYEKEGRETAQIQWERAENLYLERLCKARRLEIVHPIRESQEHLNTDLYKAKKGMEEAQEKLQELEKDILVRDQVKEVPHKKAAFSQDKVVMAAADFEKLSRTAAMAEALDQENKKARRILKEKETIIQEAKKEAEEIVNGAKQESIDIMLARANKEAELSNKVRRYEKVLEASPGLKKAFMDVEKQLKQHKNHNREL